MFAAASICEGLCVTWQRTVLAAALLLAGLPRVGATELKITPAPPPEPAWSPSITFTAPQPPPPPQTKPPPPPQTPVLAPADRQLIAACLVLEAASQGQRGMRGVMAVIRNRSNGRPDRFASTVLRVKQFSAFNALTEGRESRWRMLRRAKADRMWPVALRIVDEATRDGWRDPTRGATHYTRVGEHTPWTRTLACTAVIGRHAFYR